jgi:hypothetical protein
MYWLHPQVWHLVLAAERCIDNIELSSDRWLGRARNTLRHLLADPEITLVVDDDAAVRRPIESAKAAPAPRARGGRDA